MLSPLPSVVESTSNKEQCFFHLTHLDAPGPLMPIQFGWHHNAPSYGYGPTIRDHYLLHFIVHGRGIVQAYNTEYEVGPGQIFAIYPHQITYYQSSEEDPWEYFWIGFEGSLAPVIMTRIGFEEETNIAVHIPEPEKVFALLNDMRIHFPDSVQLDVQFLDVIGDIAHLFSLLCRDHAVPAPVPRHEVPGGLNNEYTRILLSIIHTSYSERINVEQLARRLNLNRSYMTSLFKRHTGQSIKQYLIEYRLQRAMLALQSVNLSIKKIALECGFEDALYFSRLFHQRFGVSPQEWREQNQNTPPPSKNMIAGKDS